MSDEGKPLDNYEAFLDWLETAAANSEEKKRMKTGEMKYAVIGMSEGGKATNMKVRKKREKR